MYKDIVWKWQQYTRASGPSSSQTTVASKIGTYMPIKANWEGSGDSSLIDIVDTLLVETE